MTNGTDPAAPEKHGIKETNDLLIAVMAIAILVITQLKDGFQLYGDFAAVFTKIREDEVFRDALKEAYSGISKVPAEMGDIDAGEIVQLAGTLMAALPQLLEAIKKQPE